MIRPMLMGICEVNDWGQPWEQIKKSRLTKPALLATGGCMLEEERVILLPRKAWLYLTFEFWEGRNARLLLWLRSPSDYQWETELLQLHFFLIIATNWKTIHHINIIAVFQKMEKPNKTTLIYFFCHGIGQRWYLHVVMKQVLWIILWQYDCTIRRDLNIYCKRKHKNLDVLCITSDRSITVLHFDISNLWLSNTHLRQGTGKIMAEL